MTASASAADAERWLLELENFGIRPGLDRMRALIEALGARRRPTVHLVGTNGKTSTTLLCAAMLERAGLRAGAYVSPHVERFADRIHVAGAPLSDERFAGLVARVRARAEALADVPGQFEALTAVALLAFEELDVQVLEAGLGGRLDATNAVRSDVQVLTSVGLDHQAWLGDTVEEIALEKLAVVEEGGTLVLAPGLEPPLRALARTVAGDRGARVVEAAAVAPSQLRDPLAAGGFQRENLGVALAAAKALLEARASDGAPGLDGGTAGGPGDGEPPDDAQLLAAAEARLPLRGRLEPIGHDPLVVVDAAHNVQAARALLTAYDGLAGDRPTVAVVALLDDKDPAGVLEVLAQRCRAVVATTTANPRSLSAGQVAAAAEAVGLEAHTAEDVRAAVDLARRMTGVEGAVLVTGTTSLVRELRTPGSASARSRF